MLQTLFIEYKLLLVVDLEEIMDSVSMQGNTIMHSKLLCIKGYDETAQQIDIINLTRTTGNDVNVIR